MVRNNKESLCKYWATRFFAQTAHSLACSSLLTFLARSVALIYLLARSLTPELVNDIMLFWTLVGWMDEWVELKRRVNFVVWKYILNYHNTFISRKGTEANSQMWKIKDKKWKRRENKAGYTAQDAPSMRNFTFKNNMGHTDGRTDGRTDRQTDRRTDTTSNRNATAHLKT